MRSLAQATSVHELWDASAVNSQAAAAAPRASKAQLEAMTARVRNANKNPGAGGVMICLAALCLSVD